MIELLIIFTHLLIDPGKGRWPLCVWWPWLQEAQRACGSYGKRRVCQRATACLQEEAATGVLPPCQIPFPAWENAFSESLIMTPGLTRNSRVLITQDSRWQNQERVRNYLFGSVTGRRRWVLFLSSPKWPHHFVYLILTASVESSLFVGLAQWQRYSQPVTKALRSKGLGRQTDLN